jgi:flagellar hook assembly protein FlgD
LPKAVQVELAIYNIVGQKVKLLVRGYYQPGHHEAEWQGTDDEGRPVASGVYFYRLTSEGVNETRKMLLLK